MDEAVHGHERHTGYQLGLGRLLCHLQVDFGRPEERRILRAEECGSQAAHHRKLADSCARNL